MQGTLSVCWRIIALDYPRVWRHCPNCKNKTRFICSGNFRTNAQKQRLDIWLIYRCAVCGATWNYPLYERRAVRDIAPPLLAAMSRNSVEAVRRFAFDVARLRRYVDRVDSGSAFHIEKRAEQAVIAEPVSVLITIVLPVPCDLRLDRCLAGELGLPRTKLRHLYASGDLVVLPATRTTLRRPIRNGQRIQFDLRCLADEPDSVRAIIDGAVAARRR